MIGFEEIHGNYKYRTFGAVQEIKGAGEENKRKSGRNWV